MLKALSVRMRSWGESSWFSSVSLSAVSSALLIVCLSGCDLTSICAVVCVAGLTMAAPSVGFPVFGSHPCICSCLGSKPLGMA